MANESFSSLEKGVGFPSFGKLPISNDWEKENHLLGSLFGPPGKYKHALNAYFLFQAKTLTTNGLFCTVSLLPISYPFFVEDSRDLFSFRLFVCFFFFLR